MNNIELHDRINQMIDETQDVRSWKTVLKQKIDTLFEE